MVVRDGSIRYVGGGIEYIDNLHRDYLSMFDLDKFGELVGYPAEVDIDYYYRAQTGRVGNYYPVDTDEDVVSMTQHLDKDRQCVLYIVRSKVQRYIRATARRTLLLNKSKALVILSEDESEPPQYVGGGQHGDYEYDNSSESEGQESNFVPRARQYHFGEGSGVKKRHAKRHGKKPVGEEEVGDAEGSCSGLVRAGVNHKSVSQQKSTNYYKVYVFCCTLITL